MISEVGVGGMKVVIYSIEFFCHEVQVTEEDQSDRTASDVKESMK